MSIRAASKASPRCTADTATITATPPIPSTRDRWGWLPPSIAALLDGHLGVSDADLAIIGWTRPQLGARKLGYAALGLVAPSGLALVIVLVAPGLVVFPAAVLATALAAGCTSAPGHPAAQARSSVPNYLSNFSSGQMQGWLNKQVMLAFTHMLLMAEVMGYDTAPMEGFEQEKVHEVLRLPLSYWVVALLGIGHVKGSDKFNGGRFDMAHTVFSEEFGKPLK